MNIENSTAFVLRYGSITGIAIVVTGILANLISLDIYEEIIALGIAVIIFTHFAGLLVSFTALSVNREKKYAAAALTLIMVTVIGMIVTFWIL